MRSSFHDLVDRMAELAELAPWEGFVAEDADVDTSLVLRDLDDVILYLQQLSRDVRAVRPLQQRDLKAAVAKGALMLKKIGE